MGHGFGDIRLHTDAGANRLAESLGSRAFTWGRHIVFGAGEHSEQTWEGRRLLAHELTHTIQQGAAEAGSTAASATSERGSGQAGVARTAGPRVQRLCTDLATPPVLTCQIGPASPANTGTFVEFGVNSTALTPAAQARVQGIAAVWHATGGTAVLTLHGYASEEGRETHNCPLSCTRAEAVAAELRTPSNGDPGVAAASIVTVAHGETTEFSTDLAPNRRVVITTTGGGAAPTEVITSETVVTSPGARTRTTIGVGEEVNLTHVPGSASWTTTAGTLSAATGSTVLLTAPDTAQTVTVTAGAASLAFTVLAPDSVAMDRQPGTGVKHTLNRADSGILARVFLGPDTVNFSRIRYRELDVPGIPLPGAYSCNTFSTGHCSGAAAGACPDKALTDTVTAGMGTLSVLGDCAYSGHCGGTPPFTPGAIIVLIPYEYRLGAGPFRSITTVAQVHTLAADASTLTTTKAGATGTTTVAAPTVTIAQCP
jgi:outer membrane protein OmpA-like peptidoglycan-associated protein